MSDQRTNARKSLSANDAYAILSPFAVLFSLLQEHDGQPIYATDVATIGRALYDNAMTRVREISEGGRHE